MESCLRHGLATLAGPRIVPPLDPGFRPAALVDQAFGELLEAAPERRPVGLSLDRADATRSVHRLSLLPDGHPQAALNFPYLERRLKLLLWQRGGFRVLLHGLPPPLAAALTAAFGPQGPRSFDAAFLGPQCSARPFEISPAAPEPLPETEESSRPLGGHWNGARLGFDLGASDIKTAAVLDGQPLFTEETVWNPGDWTDPEQHYEAILACLRRAAAHLPRIEAIGGSSAGVILGNQPMAASILRGIPDRLRPQARDLFLRLGQEWGVPVEVANDGEVAALAGSLTFHLHSLLGLAFGSSLASGFVDHAGRITPWLNELAFVPIDLQPEAPLDEWSGDRGVGAQYLTQQAVFRLAPRAGLSLDPEALPAHRLAAAQERLAAGDPRAVAIWETIGVYFGYAVAHFATVIPFEQVLLLGRVTSGPGGPLLLKTARAVLSEEFPALARRLTFHLPDETSRRLGQAVAAASLPALSR